MVESMVYMIIGGKTWAKASTKVEAFSLWAVKAGYEGVENVREFKVYHTDSKAFVNHDGSLVATVMIELNNIRATLQLKTLLEEVLEIAGVPKKLTERGLRPSFFVYFSPACGIIELHS